MAIGQGQFVSLGRAACRALLSGAAPHVAESSCARAVRQASCSSLSARRVGTDHAAADCKGDDAAGCAPQQEPANAQLRSDLSKLTRSFSNRLQHGPMSRLLSTGPSPASSQSHFHLPSSLRAMSLHTTSLAASTSSTTTEDSQQPQKEAPTQNPLQAALQAAEAARSGGAVVSEEAGGLAGTLRGVGAAGGRGRRKVRTWMWYDEADEREERQKERQRQQYGNAGTAYMMDVPQSMKKMDRILKLVRGLSYHEAVAQCQLVPHKAAKYVVQALERAYEDATDMKGLAADKLVVSIIYVTKGLYEKGMQPMGKGGSGSKVSRKSHLRVVLSESRGRSPSFTPRVVTPLMGVMTSRGAAPAWLGTGAGAGPARQRTRFAYRLEV